MVKREISSDKNWKEAFWEFVLCCVNSSHRVTAFPSRSRSLRLFLWNLQKDIWKPIEAYGEKENILRWKLERSFLRNCFVMYDFHSMSYSCISRSCLLALFLWNLRTDISDPLKTKRPRKYPLIKMRKKLSEKLRGDLWIHLTELQLFPQEAFR